MVDIFGGLMTTMLLRTRRFLLTLTNIGLDAEAILFFHFLLLYLKKILVRVIIK